ncbi:MAG: DUF1311 domain-containing protein [Paracoccaceae bacterium]|nr:DUF1311 domain-containing protein [Paracoccaceae bacterium]
MRALSVALALVAPLAAPGAAQAQAQFDSATVRDCFDAAGPGEIAPICLGAASDACQTQPGGSSTAGITACIGAETQAWDDLLNVQYKARRSEMLAQGGGLNDKLLDAQRAWIAYRDAECSLETARWGEGTMRAIVGANCLMGMTAARAIELRDKGARP